MQIFNICYIIIALLISLFYGSFAVRIWLINPEKYKFTQRVYQFIFNLLGGLYGFALLYYLLYKVNLSFQTNDFKTMNFGDIVILIMAIMGTMGQLPGAISNLARNIHSAIGRR